MIGDIRHGGLEEEPQPEMYINYLQGPPVSPFIVLRTTGDPALLAETVRAEARRIDKNLPLYDMRTMSTLRSEAVSTRRFMLLIVGAFGALALGLAAIGVYGVMSLIVSERTREVGVRLALGAEPSQLLRMIVMQAAKLAGIGVVIGVIVALPLAPLLDSQLYGIQSFDPMTFIVRPGRAPGDRGAGGGRAGQESDADRSAGRLENRLDAQARSVPRRSVTIAKRD